MRAFILLLTLAAFAQPPQFDLVIHNAQIIDGTGSPWFYGDLAVQGDKIVRITPRNLLQNSPTNLPDIPGFNAFHQSIWDGEINLAVAAERSTDAKLQWQRFLDNASKPQWQHALNTLHRNHAADNSFRPLLPPLPI